MKLEYWFWRYRFVGLAMAAAAIIVLPAVSTKVVSAQVIVSLENAEKDEPREELNSEEIAADSSSDELEAPIRLKAGGEYIAVESPGYASPTMADVDGDGKLDLVVGQFRSGNMMFFRNIAESGQPPQFEAGQWLMTGNERAVVPGVW